MGVSPLDDEGVVGPGSEKRTVFLARRGVFAANRGATESQHGSDLTLLRRALRRAMGSSLSAMVIVVVVGEGQVSNQV